MKLDVLRARALLVVAAVVAAVAVWAAVVPVLGVDITVPARPGAVERVPLRFAPVLSAATIAACGAWALLTVLERYGKRGVRIWTWISIVVFALTMPYMPGFTLGERVFLVALHGVMFAILVPGMRRTSTTR